ncbi:MAG: alpha/beta fold hydrolase [Ignavibacterium sp.]|nr:alpha/beta fold hydrolase [Ignavibacterium sp.]
MVDNKNIFTFPIGYNKFHKNQLFNFQLNRWYSLGYTSYEDLVDVGNRIKSFTDWKREMISLADKSIAKNEFLSAAFYYRAAEFYLLDEVPEKELLYEKFSNFFYQTIQNDNVDRFLIPYQEVFLPALRIIPENKSKGTILIHGGFDSFIEEFYSIMRYFSFQGYEVVAFEGPGQGYARRKYELALELDWEKPVKAVLDHFKLENVTILGISMGGWLCIRAAAFEPRITKVIATGHAIDYMKSMGPFVRWIHLWTMKHFHNFMDKMATKKFLKAKDSIPYWMIKHLMYITKKTKPLDALETYINMNDVNIHSELVKQDVLLLLGNKDHFIPPKMLKMQEQALVNAKSVTTKLFSKEEHAENHCQTGNIGFSLDIMIRWIEEIS